MKCQRDESLEAACFVLQRAELQQMIDAVFIVLDVTVEHGRVRLQSDLMRRARCLQPFVAVDLVVADNVPHAIRENLRAAAGQRIDSGFLQPLQRLRMVSFARFARNATSTMVNALMCT